MGLVQEGIADMRTRKLLGIIAVVVAVTMMNACKPALAGEIWAKDSSGHTVVTYLIGDTVYVKGVGLKEGQMYRISIVEDDGTQIGPGDPIPTGAILTKLVGPIGSNKKLELTPIWGPPLTPGYCDMFADCIGDGVEGKYDPGIDAKDEELTINPTAGFHVIPETSLGTIGIVLAGFTALFIRRKSDF